MSAMRTLLIIVAGFVLLALFLGAGSLITGHKKTGSVPFWLFVAVWASVAGLNMWAGVVQAGYSVTEELPVFLAIFFVPVLAGYFFQRKLNKVS
jgi:small-conductance mechanosensitive channel